ncbi:transcription factor MYC2-like [Castanea sativa]|uniref:transcription factor MYC2-like n=1 Tax=Castanea sativa TaxID=21020 RepID=UPI003F64BE55
MSQPSKPISEGRVPEATASIASIFPPNNSESSGSAPNETIPQSSNSVASVFPPTKSQSESSESNERNLQPQQTHPIQSIFQPTKSHTNSSDSLHTESIQQSTSIRLSEPERVPLNRVEERLSRDQIKQLIHMLRVMVPANSKTSVECLLDSTKTYINELKGKHQSSECHREYLQKQLESLVNNINLGIAGRNATILIQCSKNHSPSTLMVALMELELDVYNATWTVVNDLMMLHAVVNMQSRFYTQEQLRLALLAKLGLAFFQ